MALLLRPLLSQLMKWQLPFSLYKTRKKILHQFIIENTSNDDTEIIDDESNKIESTEKKRLSKKMLFKTIDLMESFALFQNEDFAKQM